jgi:predicted HicB family RNase H-like nuclease
MSDKLEPIAETSSASVNDGNSQVKEVKKKKPRTRKPSTVKAQSKKPASKTTRKSSVKAKDSVQDSLGNIKESESLPKEVAVEEESLGTVELKLSKSLHRKLIKQSYDEGVSVEEFISELLSEGVVLRAWEIVERKNAMRGSQSGNSNNSNNSNNNRSKGQGGNSKGYKNKGHRMSHGRYQSIMDDSSNFIEYVRNQERGRR